MGKLSAFTGGAGNLVKLLPTGTMFIYQFLSPVLSNAGDCNHLHKSLTTSLIVLCGISCFISSFSDSYKTNHGSIRYGFITRKGLWPNPNGEDDLSHLKLRVRDVVHGCLSLLVLAVITIMDPNTQKCLYSSLLAPSKERVLNMVLPPTVGTLAGVVFTLFPSKRHGIGYP